MTIRTEFGVERGEGCACSDCQKNCMFIPGFLIPADLERMIPKGADPLVWAETNLQASPGALAMKKGGEIFRIPTLVMASRPDGSCIYYAGGGCGIWEDSPFGCAFFGCGAQDQQRLSHEGLVAVMRSWQAPSLYNHIWSHLWDSGRRAAPPEEKRARMAG